MESFKGLSLTWNIRERRSVTMGGISMFYPIFTYEDGTEVTASKPDEHGNVDLYVEKFDKEKDTFIHATFVLPNATVKSSSGYDERELNDMLSKYSEIQDDIIGYVMDKVKVSA